MTVSALVFGRDAEGDEACEWPLRYVEGWASCAYPGTPCEEDGCALMADEMFGRCTFHGEVYLHRAAREYGEDMRS